MIAGKKIIIVGGGTAAWISAFMFKSLGNCQDISVIEPEINQPIGVGESTTPHFWFFLNRWCPYFDEKDFIKKTGSTLKFGVVHENWTDDGSRFLNPIDSLGRINKESFPTDFDYVRSYCVANGLDPAVGYEADVIKDGLVPFEATKNGNFSQKGNYAYHLNIDNTLTYFKVIGQKIGIKLIKSGVSRVNSSEGIDSLLLENGETIQGDFFVDCTGTKRILMNALHSPFILYKELPLDSAIIFKKRQETEIRNYTLAKATLDGWQWEIPVKNEIHCGYLYASDLVDESSLQEKFGPNSKLLKFQSGRTKKFLNKNVISIGLSSGFVEPLEATSLHASLVQLNVFLSEYFRPDFNYKNIVLEEKYNSRMGKFWDSIRDWIRMHYFTSRQDSLFWKEVQGLDLSLALEEKMEIFKLRMPRESDCQPDEIYQNSLTFHVLNGMNLLNPKIAERELDFYGLKETAVSRLLGIRKDCQNFTKNFVSHKYYLENI